MTSLSPVPRGLAEIRAAYGDPDADGDLTLDPLFPIERLVIVPAPYPMRVAWKPDRVVKNIQCNGEVADSLVEALTEIRDYKGEAYLYDNHFDYWGGCFCFRKMVGYDALSVHSWGCAVDICPQIGRFGNLNDALEFPTFIVSAFEARGWVWGGRWRAPWNPDAMHFQACRGY
jgi:hypothetical protein